MLECLCAKYVKHSTGSNAVAATNKASKLNGPAMHTYLRDAKTGKYAKLSDPSVKSVITGKTKEFKRSPDAASKFLKSIGVMTASGRLAKRFGG